MSVALYKPTKKNTGMAVSFQASDKDKYLYVSLIKQFSWDEQNRKGSFFENRNIEGKNTTIKFNQVEAGGMLDAIERLDTFQAYHSSRAYTTQITLGPAEGENPNCFVFRVLQTSTQDNTQKNSFFMPISWGEARLLKEYLVHYLHKSFKNGNSNNKTAPKVEEPAQPTQPEAPQQSPEQAAIADFDSTQSAETNPDW